MLQQMQQYILESKERCRALGLDSKVMPSFEVIDPRDFARIVRDYREILAVVQFFMDKLLETMIVTPIVIIVTDNTGTILEYAGDETVKLLLLRMGIRRGVRFTEERNGTNGINLALRHRSPVKLVGVDHYHEIIWELACFTTPFRDDAENVLGTITIMTALEQANDLIFTLLVTVADSIERELRLRRQNHQRLEQEQARLQAVLEQMPSGVVIVEAPSGKVISANRRYGEILRYPAAPSDLTEMYHALKRFHGDGQLLSQMGWSLFRSVHYGETVSNEETLIQRGDGTTGIILESSAPVLDRDGRVVAGVLVFTEITNLKQAMTQAALANQLRQIIEFLPDGTFVVDKERRVIAWNRANELLTGISKAEILGRKAGPQTIASPEQLRLIDIVLQGADCQWEAAIERSGDVLAQQVMLPALNQRNNVHLEIKATPLRNEYGDTLGVIETIRDITRQKELEAETIRMQKIESVGILAGGIAHDFNNYLAAILSNIQLAGLRLESGRDIRALLETVEGLVAKATGLTKQLLAFSKGGIPVKKIISLPELIHDTVKFVLRGSRASCECLIPDDLCQAEADAGQITQVLTNLLINASQAMPDGGNITVDCENTAWESLENLPLKPGEYVKIAVSDQGLGIPKENLVKIFDPYFTTKKQGNGLGLAVCYSIISNHDGYIGVESKPGVGSTFYFYLPAFRGADVAVETIGDEDLGGKDERGKILIMDDEKNIIIPVGQILQRVGYEVDLAGDGAEAITKYIKAQTDGEPYDAVILDLTVPGGMNGKRTIEQLLKISPEVRAIVCSGYSDDPVLANYKEFKFREVVLKPYKVEELRRVLYRVLHE